MKQATGERLFHDAARAWFRHAFDLRMPDVGVAGYTTVDVDGPVSDTCLLAGADGVAVALALRGDRPGAHLGRIRLLSTAPTWHEQDQTAVTSQMAASVPSRPM